MAHYNSVSRVFEDAIKNSSSPKDYIDNRKEMADFICAQIQHYDQVVDKYEKSRSVAAAYKRRACGGYVGVREGTSRITQKEQYALPRIVAWCSDFEGDLSDSEIMHNMHIKSDTYKKYKGEILELKQNHKGKYQELCDTGAIIKRNEHKFEQFDSKVDYRMQNREIGLNLMTRLLRANDSKGEQG